MNLKVISIKSFIVLLVFTFAIQSCQRYKGYSKTKTGIYYKLLYIGNEVAPPKISDFVTVNISYATSEDSVFFKGARTFQLTQPDFDGAIDECFLMLSEKDSASFIIDAEDFFTKTLQTQLPKFLQKNKKIKIGLKMEEIRTAKQYEREKQEFLKWIEDFGEYEKLLLTKFIKEEKIAAEPNEDGMYFISLKEGTGKPVESGDIVTVHYEGRFLNGKFFDSTKKRKQAFEFVYGSEMQVIPGIEKAIGRMREGEKAIVILPSSLAWGEAGSSTGIIPPFTSVIYEIELMQALSRNEE